MGNRKPKLSIDEQVQHLKSKGVLFNIMSEEAAVDYLNIHNNFFKLTSYRKNYDKHPAGENKGKYINLEFAYLVALAQIDMRIRYTIVHMALDIEHNVKLLLLRKMDEYDEDGYKIIEDFIESLDEKQKEICKGEVFRNRGNLYCGDIIARYEDDMPIWAFIEIIPFGRLINLCDFCAERFEDREMKDLFFQLKTCKEIRNAAAHSNCILNDLRTGNIRHKTSNEVTKALMDIPEMNTNFRKLRMGNARVQ